MIIAITGTPGVGKSSVADALRKKDYEVLDLFKIAKDKKFLIGTDEQRNSKIIDVQSLNDYIKNNYSKKTLVFVESHLSHSLKCVNHVIILRCHPDELKKRLSKKKWSDKKIQENLESEILDIILSETVEMHPSEKIFEIDTTNDSVDEVLSKISEIINNKFKHMKKYNIGNIDWSDEILKDF